MKRLSLIVVLLLTALSLAAQANNRNHVKYVNEKWLAQKGQDVWLVTLNLEWPQELAGKEMPVLQAYLSEKLFDQPASSLKEAMTQLRQTQVSKLRECPTIGISRATTLRPTPICYGSINK